MRSIYTFTSIESDDVTVRLYSGTAVVTGRLSVSLQIEDHRLIARFIYIHVYVKKSDRFEAVASQLTALK